MELDDGVDDVHDAVGGHEVGLDHVGVGLRVPGHQPGAGVPRGGGHGELGGVVGPPPADLGDVGADHGAAGRAHHVVGDAGLEDGAGDDVPEEDLAEGRGVLQEAGQDVLGDGAGEGVVGGGKQGEGTVTLKLLLLFFKSSYIKVN